MPPATAPIPEQILDNLEAALALPDGGADYYYDVAVVRISEDPLDQAAAPAVVIGDVGVMGRYFEEKNGSVMWHSNLHWRIPIYGVVPYSSVPGDANRNLLKLAADVYRAVSADPTRGGKAMNTTWLGFEIISPPTDGDTRPWMACEIDVHFRTRDTDMVTQ